MTFPVWSGINADWVNSTEINGCAQTPLIQTDGFSSAIFPVLMGAYPGLYFEVMRTRPEERRLRLVIETRAIVNQNEGRATTVLSEDRSLDVDRSRKRFP